MLFGTASLVNNQILKILTVLIVFQMDAIVLLIQVCIVRNYHNVNIDDHGPATGRQVVLEDLR